MDNGGVTEDSEVEQFQKRVRQGLISLPEYVEFRLAKTYLYQYETCGFTIHALNQLTVQDSSTFEFAYDLLWLVLLYKRNCALRDAEIVARELRASFKPKKTHNRKDEQIAKFAEACGVSNIVGIEVNREPPIEQNVLCKSLYQWSQWRRVRTLLRSVRASETGDVNVTDDMWTVPKVMTSLQSSLPHIEKWLRLQAPNASTYRQDAAQTLSGFADPQRRAFHLDWDGKLPNLTEEQLDADKRDTATFFELSTQLLCIVDTVELSGEKGYLLKQFWKHTHHEWLLGLFTTWTRRGLMDPVSETLSEAISVNLLSVLKTPVDDMDEGLAEDLDSVTPLLQDMNEHMAAFILRAQQVAVNAAVNERWEESSFWGLLGGNFVTAAACAQSWEDVLMAVCTSIVRTAAIERSGLAAEDSARADLMTTTLRNRLLEKMPTPFRRMLRANAELIDTLQSGGRVSGRGDQMILSHLKSMLEYLTTEHEQWKLLALIRIGWYLSEEESMPLDKLLTYLGRDMPHSTGVSPQEAMLSRLVYLEVGIVLLLCEYDAGVMNVMVEDEENIKPGKADTRHLMVDRIDDIVTEYINLYQEYRLHFGSSFAQYDHGPGTLQFIISAIDITSPACHIKLMARLIETEMRVLAATQFVTLSSLSEPYATNSTPETLLEILSAFPARTCIAILESITQLSLQATVRCLLTLEMLGQGEEPPGRDGASDLSHEFLLTHYQSMVLLIELCCRVAEQSIQKRNETEEKKKEAETPEANEVPEESARLLRSILSSRDAANVDKLLVERCMKAKMEWHSSQDLVTLLNKICGVVSTLVLSCSVMESAYFERLREAPLSRKRAPSRAHESTSPFRTHSMWGTSARLTRDSVGSEKTEISSVAEQSELAILWDQPLLEARADELVRPVWVPLQHATTSLKVGIRTCQLIERVIFQTLILSFLQIWSRITEGSHILAIGRKMKVTEIPGVPRVDYELLKHQEMKLRDPWVNQKDMAACDNAVRTLLHYLELYPQDVYYGLRANDEKVIVSVCSPLPIRQFDCILTSHLVATTITRCGCLLCEKSPARDLRSRWVSGVSTWLNDFVRPRALCRMWPDFEAFESSLESLNTINLDQTPVAIGPNDQLRADLAQVLQDRCLTRFQSLATLYGDPQAAASSAAPLIMRLRRKNVDLQRQFVTVLFEKFVRILSASKEDAAALTTCRELAQQCDEIFGCALQT